MDNNKFDKQIRKIIDSEISIPDNLEKIINDNINLKESYVTNKKINLKNKLNNFIRIIIGLFSVFAVSATTYAVITGNSILSLIGLGKASLKFEESSISINRTIDGDLTKITLNKIACDSSFVILEYNIELKDSFYNTLNSQGYNKNIDNISLGNVNKFLNGSRMQEYIKYSQKVDNNNFKYYEVISISNKNISNLKMILPIDTLIINNEQEVSITKTIYHPENNSIEYENKFYIDISISSNENMKDDAFKTYQINNSNSMLTLEKVSNTDFGTFALVTVNLYNLKNGEEELTNLDVKLSHKNQLEKLKTVLLRNQITTENDELIDLLEVYTGNNEVFDNRTGSNVETSVNWQDLKYNNGTAEIKYLLMFTEESDANEFLIDITRNNTKLFKNIKIPKNISQSYETIINEIGTKDSDIQDYRLYYHNENSSPLIKNPYYNPNAPKIDLKEFDICGFKLGMNYSEVMKQLKKLYETNNIEFDDDLISNSEYSGNHFSDDNFILEFEDKNGSYVLTRIVCSNTNLWNNGKTTEKDIISSYYSEEYYTFLEGVYNEKVLYGVEEYKKVGHSNDYNYGDYGYILVIDDKDYNICYYDSSIKSIIYLNLDQITKKITSIGLQEIYIPDWCR